MRESSELMGLSVVTAPDSMVSTQGSRNRGTKKDIREFKSKACKNGAHEKTLTERRYEKALVRLLASIKSCEFAMPSVPGHCG